MTEQPEKKFITTLDLQILRLIARGMKTKDIAQEIGYSKQTLDSYRRDIYKFLGAKNSTHAVVIALQEGYLKLEELQEKPPETALNE